MSKAPSSPPFCLVYGSPFKGKTVCPRRTYSAMVAKQLCQPIGKSINLGMMHAHNFPPKYQCINTITHPCCPELSQAFEKSLPRNPLTKAACVSLTKSGHQNAFGDMRINQTQALHPDANRCSFMENRLVAKTPWTKQARTDLLYRRRHG